ncbi:hypothetical protein V6N13_041359 [Hibiscus sabdariffa]|uniref:Uncharacterized protein n=1 Tax=Hibiscus sabdariffa TaxID=183260 RepID=A0ABR2RBE6_9ROSI
MYGTVYLGLLKLSQSRAGYGSHSFSIAAVITYCLAILEPTSSASCKDAKVSCKYSNRLTTNPQSGKQSVVGFNLLIIRDQELKDLSIKSCILITTITCSKKETANNSGVNQAKLQLRFEYKNRKWEEIVNFKVSPLD